jgi:hypothetical protein
MSNDDVMMVLMITHITRHYKEIFGQKVILKCKMVPFWIVV